MKKKPYYKAIIIGFLVFYLFSMILSTYFVTNRFKQEYEYALKEVISDTRTKVLGHGEAKYDVSDNMPSPLLWHISTEDVFQQTEEKYQQFSIALYDRENEKKLVQTSSYVYLIRYEKDNPMRQTIFYYLDDYLTKEEMIDLAKFSESCYDPSVLWYISMEMEEDAYHPYSIKFQSAIRENDSGDFIRSDSSWTWESANAKETSFMTTTGGTAGDHFTMPYLAVGVKQYTKWLDNEFLHDFPDTWEGTLEESQTLFTINEEYVDRVFSDSYSLRIRSTSQPLLAAMDYLKYIYIVGFVLTLACIIIIIHFTNKTYKQRVILEETRRDFTNNVANELKVPLGVIRECSEKLQDDMMSENKESYLKQIINQTENMNEKVQEMIDISKQDIE